MKFNYQFIKAEMINQIFKNGWLKSNSWFAYKFVCSKRWVQKCLASLKVELEIISYLVKKRKFNNNFRVVRYITPSKKFIEVIKTTYKKVKFKKELVFWVRE